uniref:Ferritin n=1 Tax=Salix viminalis TaxID=40686 RepID=A0A6N2K8X4_SALVM
MAATLLRSVSAFCLATKQGDSAGGVGASGGNGISSMPLFSRKKRNTSLVVCSATGGALTGLVFQPFEEVKREDFLVPISRQVSLARQFYVDECEAAINEQINVEYSASYVYHAMFAYFDRDNVALKGLAKFFKESSEEEREHAEKFMKFQNIRGGKVVLHSILNPVSEFEHAMELALSLEKLTNEKLLSLHKVADKSNDPEMQHFIESEYLEEQVESIKKIAEYVTQLRMECGTLIRCSSMRHDGKIQPASTLGSTMASTVLRSVSAFSLATKQGDTASGEKGISSLPLFSRKKRNTSLVVCSATGEALTGLVFQPFEEVKREEFYMDECEAAINEQINVEYSASYVYHAMFAYFDRDNIALKGLAKNQVKKKENMLKKLMKYQNIRGGKVVLHSILTPLSEFEHIEKGDALYAMELALSLEKLTNEKLLSLHKVADKNNDPQMADFIESEFLEEQVESIKKIAEYVTQLRMVGKGHGVWHFDQMLLDEA